MSRTTLRGISLLLPLSLIYLFSCSCQNPSLKRDEVLRILSYNVQTLFDDELQGSEFPEYRPDPEGWNSAAYHGRLRNLARVIRECCPGGPDLVVLQEVEGPSVVRDLVRYFLRGMGYRFQACGRSEGFAFGQAVLSRYPILQARTLSACAGDSGLRPALELHIRTGMPGSSDIILFAVHWKSKLENVPGESEILRRMQAHGLARRCAELLDSSPEVPIIIAGDFNESPGEFVRTAQRRFPTALVEAAEYEAWLQVAPISDDPHLEPLVLEAGRLPDGGADRDGRFYHFWGLSGVGGGSYRYGGAWERIDNILIPAASAIHFSAAGGRVVDDPFLLTRRGEPAAYRRAGGFGYSDHLPVLLELTF
jgi:endonuclease/exonuclease/phosphatase family metal-dependent hydrolase